MDGSVGTWISHCKIRGLFHLFPCDYYMIFNFQCVYFKNQMSLTSIDDASSVGGWGFLAVCVTNRESVRYSHELLLLVQRFALWARVRISVRAKGNIILRAEPLGKATWQNNIQLYRSGFGSYFFVNEVEKVKPEFIQKLPHTVDKLLVVGLSICCLNLWVLWPVHIRHQCWKQGTAGLQWGKWWSVSASDHYYMCVNLIFYSGLQFKHHIPWTH